MKEQKGDASTPTGLGGISKMEEQKGPADARELFVITNRTFHPPLPVVDSIEGNAAFLLKRVKAAIADTELVGEAVYYHAVWNGWFNKYFICGLTGIGKRKSQAPVITYLKDRNLIDTQANWIRPVDRPEVAHPVSNSMSEK